MSTAVNYDDLIPNNVDLSQDARLNKALEKWHPGYLDWWKEHVLPGTVRESTADGYRYILTRYVEPNLGSRRLAQLRPEDVLSLLRQLEAQGYAVRTRQQVRAVLRRALRDAERYDLVARNAAAVVDPPRERATKTTDAFSRREIVALLKAAKEDRLEALAHIALTLGLRRGECLGLRWTDIDFDSSTIHVRRTLKRRTGVGLVVDAPKTGAGLRALPLMPEVVRVLRSHRSSQAQERLAAGPAWQSGEYVFATSIGTPVDPRNLTRWWHSLCGRAGVPPRRFHAARHAAATVMRDAGVPLEVVSKILGHASVAITGDIYAKPSADSLRDAAELTQRALAGIE